MSEVSRRDESPEGVFFLNSLVVCGGGWYFLFFSFLWLRGDEE